MSIPTKVECPTMLLFIAMGEAKSAKRVAWFRRTVIVKRCRLYPEIICSM
jgi:hypothetical protein